MTPFEHYADLLTRMARPPKIAQTPSRVIYRENKLRVLYYRPVGRRRHRTPVLIVNSLINKYYILDLTPGKSFVEFLTGQGFPVYMIDWGTPDASDSTISMTHHINHYLPNIVEAVTEHAGSEKVSLLGYCMGGTMTLMFAAVHPKKIRNIVLLATPVNFENEAMLNLWAGRQFFDVDKMVDTFGNPPELLLQTTFAMMKPTKNVTKYIDLFQNAGNREFVDTFLAFDYWVNDVVSMPGETFRQFVKWCYHENRLFNGTLKIGRRVARLDRITAPILNILANHDDVVPRGSSECVMELVSSRDRELLAVNGGHHGISIGPSAVAKVWPHIAEWLGARD